MSIAYEAIVEYVAASCDANSHFVEELNFPEEVADEEGSLKLEILKVPDCEPAVFAARDQDPLLVGVDFEIMDGLHVEGKRTHDESKVLALQDAPDTDHPIFPPTVHSESQPPYLVESSS